MRVLYSFPHKLGAARICTTAWHEVHSLALAGAQVSVITGSICRPLPDNIQVFTTLSWGRLRIPYRILGSRRASILHDIIVSARMKKFREAYDVVHVWPLGSLQTIRTARAMGIASFLERPNAHTRFAYEVVQAECKKLGITMPPGHEHAFNPEVLKLEEAEYAEADFLLCPSDFVRRTFIEKGFEPAKLLRHQYGFDEKKFFPSPEPPSSGSKKGLTVLFAGGCAPRKGLHYALDAWLQSSASQNGEFLVAGGFVPGYAERLSSQLGHKSVRVLGHRNDLPELMRRSDILVLPSIEEGSALVTSEARGSGCVLLVSTAAGAVCEHEVNALVHEVGDVADLLKHLNLLDSDRNYLHLLRRNSLAEIRNITWNAAGSRLLEVYKEGLITRSYDEARDLHRPVA